MQPFTSHRTINGRVSRRAALLLGTALTAGVLSQGTFISGAYAANECGAPVNQAVVCDATSYQAAEGDIGYFNPGALTLTLQDLTVTANTAVRLTNSAVTPGDAAIIVENTDITSATGAGVQVNVASDSAATLTVNSGSSIFSGNTNAAFVRSVGGTVTVTTEAGTTLNGGANGLQTRTEEDNLTTVTIGGEVIGGTGSAVATAAVDGDTVITIEETASLTGTGNSGIYALSDDGDITISTDAGSTVTTGNGVNGFFGIEAAADDGTIKMTLDGEVSDGGVGAFTSGTGAINISVLDRINSAFGNGVEADVVDGDITISVGNAENVAEIDAALSGIFAESYGSGAILIDVAAGSSITSNSGDYYGIEADSLASGLIDISNAGTITSLDDGINVFSDGIGAVTVENTGSVSSTDGDGISISKFGSGAVSVLNSGAVGTELLPIDSDGIYVDADSTSLVEVTNEAGGLIFAGSDGIDVNQDGSGGVVVLNYGSIGSMETRTGDNGIEVTGDSSATLTVGNYSAESIYADGNGIDVDQDGDGNVVVENGGGTAENPDGIIVAGGLGINARSDGGDVTVSNLRTGDEPTGGILSQEDGIRAVTNTDGNVLVTNTSVIFSLDEQGIVARVNGTGAGSVTIANSGTVQAENQALHAVKEAGSGDLTIENTGGIDLGGLFGGTTILPTGAFSRTDSAIHATNRGTGATNIGNSSLAIGRGRNPEQAVVRIEAVADGSVEFVNTGIIASNDAVDALTDFIDDPETQDILSDGDLGALFASGAFATFTTDLRDASENLAIYASGDSATDITAGAGGEYTNAGLMVGRVNIDSTEDNFFVNAGLWLTHGVNDFGEGEGNFVGNGGLIQTAFVYGEADSATFSGLDVFQNAGLLSMIDNFGALAGVEGTPLANTDEIIIEGTYESTEGFSVLAVDATLGAADQADSSDLLIVADVDADEVGAPGGSLTSILVLDSNASGTGALNLDGVALVRVENGDAFVDNWELNEGSSNYDSSRGVIDKGFVYYGLEERDGPDASREIVLIGLPDVEAYQAASIITGAQEIWHNTTAIYSERHADLRDFIMAGVNSRAERADLPVDGPAPTTTANNVTPGVWAKGFGGWVQNDGEAAGFDTGFDQDIYGMMAGIDTGRESVWSADDAILGGVFAGYLSSDLDFNTGGSSIDYEGFTVGGYASFLKGNFFVDATIKADFLEIEGAGGVFGDLSTDATSIGGTLESGYRFWFNRFFVEPNAVLAYVQTDIDDATVLGGDIDFADDAESLRGGVGIRVGGNVYTGMTHTVGVSLVGRAWNEFEGENQVTIGGEGGFDIVDQGPEDVYGELGGTLSVTSRTTGWSGQVSGSYKFNDEYESASVKGGVRYQW